MQVLQLDTLKTKYHPCWNNFILFQNKSLTKCIASCYTSYIFSYTSSTGLERTLKERQLEALLHWLHFLWHSIAVWGWAKTNMTSTLQFTGSIINVCNPYAFCSKNYSLKFKLKTFNIRFGVGSEPVALRVRTWHSVLKYQKVLRVGQSGEWKQTLRERYW